MLRYIDLSKEKLGLTLPMQQMRMNRKSSIALFYILYEVGAPAMAYPIWI